MNYGWIYTRDAILVDESFKKKIDEALSINKVQSGSTILLAARDFKVKGGYTFELAGYDLVILVDTLDGGANGTIALTVPTAPTDFGLPGQKLTVFCKRLMGFLHLRSQGG